MRFHVGSSVEVASRIGSLIKKWRPAEVVQDYGHNCLVRYACGGGASANPALVSRKAVRPRPPHFSVSEMCKAGDAVEVFVNGSWYCAEVCKRSVTRCKVRIIGSSKFFEAQSANLRAHHMWSNGRWILIKKTSEKHNGSTRRIGKKHRRTLVDRKGFNQSKDPTSEDEGAASSVGSNSPSSPNKRLRRSNSETEYPQEPPDKKQKLEQLHQAEFESYASCLLAFYLSGPLSWEKQELLTNLRLELHISNDEHLQVLRNLESVEASVLSRT